MCTKPLLNMTVDSDAVLFLTFHETATRGAHHFCDEAQCDISTGNVISRMIERVTPPKTNSVKRL